MIFNEFKINKVSFLNRIIVSSMCQYSARDGSPTLWHYHHLSSLVNSGAGGLMLESTAINNEGKITHGDLSISKKKQINEIKKLIKYLKKLNNKIPIGLQISHSGRKGSANFPWIKKGRPLKNNSWKTLAPSAIRRSKGWPIPKQINDRDIKRIKINYDKSTIAANQAGFDCLEIHMAHGYLLHEFMSPITNLRNDRYGGTLENRCRLLVEISKIVRKRWPKIKCLGARITGSDHLKNGIKEIDAIYLAKELEKIGFDYICVSSGGIIPKTKMKFKKGFRAGISKKIKKKLKLKVSTTGMLDDLNFIKKGIKNKSFDFVFIGRPFLKNPRWIFEKVSQIKNNNIIPKQYLRGFN
jgi:2,4-dienoyl-CoA reductase-like NADH-dependent reductase (Old Yellow Enzyme family)